MTKGFSLIELMITVAVLAILLTIGIPSFQSQFENSRFSAARESVLTALSQARSEALTRGLAVELCKGNGAGCNDGTDWSDGWVLVTTDASPEVLRVFNVAKGTTVTLGGASRVRYLSDGSSASSNTIAIDYSGTSLQLDVLQTGAVVEQ